MTLSGKISKHILTFLLIISLVFSVSGIGVYATENEKQEDIKVYEVVYKANEDYLTEHSEEYVESQEVSSTYAFISSENRSDNIDQLINETNQKLDENNVGVELIEANSGHEKLGVGYLTSEKTGAILPQVIETEDTNEDDESSIGEENDNDVPFSQEEEEDDDPANDIDAVSETFNSLANENKSEAMWVTTLTPSVSKNGERVRARVTRGGAVPDYCKVTVKVQNRLTGHKFATKKKKSVNLRTKKSGSVSYGTTKTRIWRCRVVGTCNYAKVDLKTVGVVYNKKCVRYPKYTEYYSKKKMKNPATNWKKIPKKDRVKWNGTKRKNYIKWFKKKYPKSKNRNWKKFQIHHVRPVAYAGKNKYKNLLPVKKTYHETTINNWWKQY